MAVDVTTTDEWQALRKHAEAVRGTHLRELFAADRARGERLTVDVADLHVDYCKNLVTDETLTLLTALAERVRLTERIAAMFAGEHINVTEDRAVLHTALRLPAATQRWSSTGRTSSPTCTRCSTGCTPSPTRVRSGEWSGRHRRARSARW